METFVIVPVGYLIGNTKDTELCKLTVNTFHSDKSVKIAKGLRRTKPMILTEVIQKRMHKQLSKIIYKSFNSKA